MSTSLLSETIDLANVDYDDVLHLYQGWKKTEAALREKNKELIALRERAKQLQDSHTKFRGQIQALESVKELTVSLQSQVSMLQKENVQLSRENKELSDLNDQAEEMIQERVLSEANQSKMLREIQIEFATLRGRYEEMGKSQNDLETLAADEQSMRVAAETRLQSTERTSNALREENKALRSKLESMSMKMSQCDNELAHAAEQLGSLSHEVTNMSAARDQLSSAEAECGVLKGDIARLIRLLEHYPVAKAFLKRWNDSTGMSFVGLNYDEAPFPDADFNTGTHKATNSFAESLLRTVDLGIDSSNKNHRWTQGDLSKGEYEQLKRRHTDDPFPMSSSFEEEQQYWVPELAAKIGVEFFETNIPHAPKAVIMDFLRKLNKVWLKREGRKLKRVQDAFEGRIKDLKRQLSNSKPYQGVMAEKTIRRLSSQVLAGRKKVLTGKAKQAGDDHFSDLDDDLFEDIDHIDHVDRPPHHRRLCQVEAMKNAVLASTPRVSGKKGNIQAVSAEKLLQASLTSLDKLGKQVMDTMGDGELSYDQHLGSGRSSGYPSESYLRGATWLGRNMSMLIEELAQTFEALRSKHMTEVSGASHDSDLQRSCHRLNLLATSIINTVIAETSKSRLAARDILQGASSVAAGDTIAFNALLETLPIESSLPSSSFRAASNEQAFLRSSMSPTRSYSDSKMLHRQYL